jgi:hypothetical protein
MERLSELISRLQEMQQTHGDLFVILVNEDNLAVVGQHLDIRKGSVSQNLKKDPLLQDDPPSEVFYVSI